MRVAPRKRGHVDESNVEEAQDDEDADASEVSPPDTSNANLSVDLIRPELVERVFNSLAADAIRGDGRLKRSDINRTYLRKQLSIAECIEVEGLLSRAAGISIEDDEDAPPNASAAEPIGSNGQTRYLTHAEEREFGRCIRLAAQLPENTAGLDAEYVGRVRAAAMKARDAFVSSNLRYVEMLALRHGERRFIEMDDLKQEGVIGLLRAVELYDPERGFRFKTYATWWIDQRMNRAIADEDRIVRLPVHVRERLSKIRRARSKLKLANGRAPTEGELADSLGLDRERLMKLLWRVQATEVAEGDAPVNEGDDLMSRVPDSAASQFDLLSQLQLEQRIDDLLSTLTPRESRIIRMRFGLGVDQELTLEKIGQEFSVTRERIRQIEMKALGKLKHPVRSQYLLAFWEN